jgi:hypothetical protein
MNLKSLLKLLIKKICVCFEKANAYLKSKIYILIANNNIINL